VTALAHTHAPTYPPARPPQVPEDQVAEALRFAAAAVEPLLPPQLALAASSPRPCARLALAPLPAGLEAAVEALALERAREVFGGGGPGPGPGDAAGKLARGAAVADLQADVLSGLRLQGLLPDAPGGAPGAPGMATDADALRALDALASRVMREGLLAGGRRADGRRAGQLRRLYAAAGVLPRVVHGSGLFERGDTQCLAAATVAPEREAVAADGWGGPLAAGGALDGGAAAGGSAPAAGTASGAAAAAAGAPGVRASAAPGASRGAGAAKRLLLHYSFPPFCTGEVGKHGPPGRREIGHGALAEKALAPLMPPPEEFPFWARVSAETLGSSGSSSMAAVCAGALALRVAGVPLVGLAAGVSVGLAVERAPQIQVGLDGRAVRLAAP
jgi:polyribonucleotide nucleotidyltransferase